MPDCIVMNRTNVGSNAVETRLTFNEATSEFELYDYIMPKAYYEDDTAVTPTAVMDFLKQASGDITVRINSRGGEVGSALVMYNRLKEYDKGSLTTIVDGYAFSSAGWVAMAGTTRLINKGGLFMMHNPAMFPQISSEEDLETVGNQWRAHRDSIVDIFAEATNEDKDTLKSMMQKETYMTADEAVEAGFFTGVRNAKANTEALNCFRSVLPANISELVPPVSNTSKELQLRAMQLRKKLFT